MAAGGWRINARPPAAEITTMSNRVKYRYIGDGAYVVGVPARDIREEESAEYEEAIEANMENAPNPCYRLVGERTHHKTSEAKPPPEEKAVAKKTAEESA
jgi:hypothetical protein